MKDSKGRHENCGCDGEDASDRRECKNNQLRRSQTGEAEKKKEEDNISFYINA